jgi:glycyl-tRNA synthetase
MVNNETLGYFMARTHMWLAKIGVDPKKMRFRQHLKTEMAHYASDCWDMEVLVSVNTIHCLKTC